MCFSCSGKARRSRSRGGDQIPAAVTTSSAPALAEPVTTVTAQTDPVVIVAPGVDAAAVAAAGEIATVHEVGPSVNVEVESIVEEVGVQNAEDASSSVLPAMHKRKLEPAEEEGCVSKVPAL